MSRWHLFFLITPTFLGAWITSRVQTDAVWAYPAVVGVGVGYIVYVIAESVRGRSNRAVVTDDQREAAYNELRGLMERLAPSTTPHVETATFLLDTKKGNFDRVYAASDNLESKATTLLGIVTGATSAFGIFGIAKASSTLIATPLVETAFAFVLISFGALLFMLRAKPFDIPDMTRYLTAATVAEDNRIPLALVVAERFREMRTDLAREIAAEPNALAIPFGTRCGRDTGRPQYVLACHASTATSLCPYEDGGSSGRRFTLAPPLATACGRNSLSRVGREHHEIQRKSKRDGTAQNVAGDEHARDDEHEAEPVRGGSRGPGGVAEAQLA